MKNFKWAKLSMEYLLIFHNNFEELYKVVCKHVIILTCYINIQWFNAVVLKLLLNT